MAEASATRSKVFAVDPKGINFPRGLVLAALLVPLVILVALDLSRYWLSFAFGSLFVGLSDPGGLMGRRTAHLAVVALIGAALTALGFAIGSLDWWWAAVATFLVTVVTGLSVRYGVNSAVAGLLLAVWFLIALGVGASNSANGIAIEPWAQALAWLAGSVVWIVIIWTWWLIRGRQAPPKPVPEIPGDLTPRPLSRPVILYAVIRAAAVSIAVAIAFGLALPNAYWVAIAAFIAIRPKLDQARLYAEQRVAGAAIGAVAASLILAVIDDQQLLALVIVVLGAVGTTIRLANYALYTAAIATAVLIALGLSDPVDRTVELERLVYTLVGVGIGLAVMVFAGWLAKRTQPTPA